MKDAVEGGRSEFNVSGPWSWRLRTVGAEDAFPDNTSSWPLKALIAGKHCHLKGRCEECESEGPLQAATYGPKSHAQEWEATFRPRLGTSAVSRFESFPGESWQLRFCHGCKLEPDCEVSD